MLKIRPLALVLGVLCAAFLAALSVGAVMHGFSRVASWEIRQRPELRAAHHNAIKHAYASAEIYSLLRPLFGADAAAATVVALGEWNERAERVVKRTTDWSPEVYKDLRNNLAGIAAAEWLYNEAGFTSPLTRLRLIGVLAGGGVLALTDRDPRLPDLPLAPDTGSALARMQGDEAELARRLAEEVAARGHGLKRDLGL